MCGDRNGQVQQDDNRLTTPGQKLLERAIPSWKEAQERVKELPGGGLKFPQKSALRLLD